MGNMPSRWGGRLAAVVIGLLFAGAAFYAGGLVGDRLANGFQFDWYRHPAGTAFPASDVLLAVGLVAGGAAVFALALATGPTALVARWLNKRARYSPPRHAKPRSLDVHAGLLFVLLPVGLALLGALLGYAVLQAPQAQGGTPIKTVSSSGYVLLVSAAAAFGAGITGLVTVWSTFSGVVSGRIVRDAERNLISHVSLFGMRHSTAVVAGVVVLTLVAGYYAQAVNTNVDVADVLPRGDPNTDAAHNLTAKFKSSFTQQITFQFHVLDYHNSTQKDLYDKEAAAHLPNRVTTADPSNITDEVYVRAIDEVVRFTLAQPPFTGSVGIQDFYKLINWTLAGGQSSQNSAGNASFALPDASRQGEIQFQSVQSGVQNVTAVYQATDAVSSPNWTQTAVLVLVDPKANLDSKDIGEAALHLRDAWVRYAATNPNAYKVFGPDNPPQFSVDLPLANAHASDLTKHDFSILMPVIGIFIALTLYIAFRSLLAVFITFSMLAIAVVWTFGVMGWMHIPLNTLNLAVVPLIMGCGIDYGIHMMNEYDELRHAGKTPEQAWAIAGGGSALALFVGTLTTIAGLLIMVISPSLLVAQLGGLAAIAISSCFLLAILFVPAVTTMVSRIKDPARATKAKEYQPSRIMPAFATGVSRARWAVLLVLVIVSVAAIGSALTIRREAFGDPPRNWLPSDPLRQEHEKALAGFYETGTDDVKANVLVFEGDLTNPAAHAYIANITSTLRSNAENGTWTDSKGVQHKSRVIADTLKDIPFLLNTYVTVKDGVPGAARLLGAQALNQYLAPAGGDPTKTQSYPQTQAEIKQDLDQAHDSPLFELQNLFIDYPDYTTGVTIFSVKAASYADAQEVWAEIQDTLAKNEALRPADVHTSFFGNTAINYLFVAKQVPWLGYMSIGTNIAVVVIVFLFTRNLRTTLVVGACNFLSSALWLGALTLPFIDIGLSISLTLPLIFIFCMGSDYGLHLALRCKKTGDTRVTFEGVGKGVLYSFVTTIGAFLVFTQVSDLAGRQAMIATSIAIAVVFVMTLAVVPIFFPVKRKKKGGEPDRNVPVEETRSLTPGEPARSPAPTTFSD